MSQARKLTLYTALSKISFLKKSYALKFLFVAFIGTHIPLLGLIGYFAFQPQTVEPIRIIFVAVGLTLLAAGITLFVLHRLLAPLLQTKQALSNYISKKKLPNLPGTYTDEAGMLMKYTQQTLTRLHDHIEEKTDLASMLSHDLRTPFTQCLGILEAIKAEDDQVQINTLCDTMIAEGQKHLGYLERVLSSLRSEYYELEDSAGELIEARFLCEAAIKASECQSIKKGVKVSTEIRTDAKISANREKAEAALKNLINNAIKFSRRGDTVIVRAIDAENGIRISVIDQGIGFDEKRSKMLFTKFSSGETGTDGEPSVGFGLYSVKRNIEALGGKVSAKSPGPGKGSRFDLEIPAG